MQGSRKGAEYSTERFAGILNSPHRSFLWSVGLDPSDIGKPLVGVVTAWSESGPCNFHTLGLVGYAKQGLREAGCAALAMPTIVVNDNISMGTPGMRYSLISRELIADSVEAQIVAHAYDGFVAIGGCDKTQPGLIMAMARINRPSIYMYGGSAEPGFIGDKKVTIEDVHEYVGAYISGKISEQQLLQVELAAHPTYGACAGLFTANTMALLSEALGVALLGSSSPTATSSRRAIYAYETGKALGNLLENGIKPRDILTYEAFRNAITVLMASGGSTNGVLHLLAIAHEAGVKLALDDFDEISRKTPYILNMRPAGEYVMMDLDRVGGAPLILKKLLKAGLIDGGFVDEVSGQRFESTRVSDAYSNPNFGFPGGRFIGDYFAIAASADDVYMVWADCRLGEFTGLSQKIAFARRSPIRSPSIFVTPPTGIAGRDVLIVGSNFQPDSNIYIELSGTVVAYTKTNEEGAFAARIFTPLTSEGQHTLAAYDQTGNFAVASFYIEFGFNNVAELLEESRTDKATLEKILARMEELVNLGNSTEASNSSASGAESSQLTSFWALIFVGALGVALGLALGLLLSRRPQK